MIGKWGDGSVGVSMRSIFIVCESVKLLLSPSLAFSSSHYSLIGCFIFSHSVLGSLVHLSVFLKGQFQRSITPLLSPFVLLSTSPLLAASFLA